MENEFKKYICMCGGRKKGEKIIGGETDRHIQMHTHTNAHTVAYMHTEASVLCCPVRQQVNLFVLDIFCPQISLVVVSSHLSLSFLLIIFRNTPGQSEEIRQSTKMSLRSP